MRSDIFDQSHAEIQTNDRFVLQNPRMLRAFMGPDLLAAKGSMVAYQGAITFHHEGSGSLSKFVRRAVTSEDQPLMRVTGQGEVFFARNAANVFLLQLEGDGISIGSSALLAFDAQLEWDIRRTQGAGIITGGFFNTVVSGHGTVALTSAGTPLILDCSQQPTFVDPQAAVCWSANLQPSLVSSMQVSSLIRGGSGEAFQYSFHGPGFVIVQPSEGYGTAG